jgi:KUP system potassium uptake protein
MVLVVTLALTFGDSASLAAAYGVAVSGDLLLTSVLMLITLPLLAASRLRWLAFVFVGFAVLELCFFAANATKIPEGGWVPLALAAAVFTVLTTWRRGIEIMRAKKEAGPKAALDGLSIDVSDIVRVPGVAVFFSSSRAGCPSAFLHNLKHNRIVHEHTIFLTVEYDETPRVRDDERVEVMRGVNGIARVIAHLGYRETPDVLSILRHAARKGLNCDTEELSFFTSKPTIASVSRRGLFSWRRSFFGWMLQNSTSVADYFRLPPNRVIELGAQVAI